ncbi:MAG TPA: RcnB family protein [Allosphingosinicella sp.]|nr:RcnB family protein [Allosphingosinicella sp.]
MSKLWLIGLAASAAWTPAAMAQHAPPPPPAPPPPMAHPGMHHPMPMPGGSMKGFHRFGRGHVVPPHFRGGQFVVHDWRMFGWPAPMPGGRWIRYHDDALLIDRDGRVVDGRYGWDWDGRRDRMAYDDGRWDEGYDRDEDYGHGGEWAEDGHHGDGRRVVRIIRRGDGRDGDCRRSCTGVRHMPPPPPPHPGYGYGYGYGCGCGPVVVTETITTTAPVVETRTYFETVYERAAPRRHYSKPVVRHSVKPAVRRSVKAAPGPGERG